MKRRLLILVSFLLLGAVVNVAVAWGCALALDPMKGRETSGIASTTRESWMVGRITRLGVTIVISTRVAPRSAATAGRGGSSPASAESTSRRTRGPAGPASHSTRSFTP